ncbi:MAG: small basic protein [Candidatus Omnitrophica bacterium]|nr:small basic protein [Candidatus Omnitrophota bacterium]MDD5771221.1 small basic protein [Candidatus Omnitrophota bacterium]
MSIHPSLVLSEKDKLTRSVMKRTERIRQMHEKGKWKEGDSVYGLPKIKTIKIKIKKEKAVKADATAEAGAAAAPAAKEAKAAAPKAQEKK